MIFPVITANMGYFLRQKVEGGRWKEKKENFSWKSGIGRDKMNIKFE
jgi:hypothetical protein